MNLEGETASAILTTMVGRMVAIRLQQQRANKCTPTASKNAGKNHSGNGNCTAIVPYSVRNCPTHSDLLEVDRNVLTKTRSSLEVFTSKYMKSLKSERRRYSPYERRISCLSSQKEENLDVIAIRRLNELTDFVQNSVADMSRPIWILTMILSDIAREALRCELQEQVEVPREQLVAHKMVIRNAPTPEIGAFLSPSSNSVLLGDSQFPPPEQERTPEDGAFLSPGSSSVLTDDSQFPPPEQEHSQGPRRMEDVRADEILDKHAIPVEELTSTPTGTERQGGADFSNERAWYKKKLEERNKEIKALRSTVHDLMGLQKKIKVEFDKVKRHIFKGAARGVGHSSFLDGRPCLYFDLLDSAVKSVYPALDSFTSHFVAYSEARIHKPANKIWRPNFRNMYFSKEAHWTYALKAFFAEKMFVGFENESFMTDAASLYLDQAILRKESYEYFKRVTTVGSSSACIDFDKDAHFKTFCQQKFDSIVPDAILLQPGDYNEDDIENSSFTLAEINLSKSFMAAAMKVWTLHKLCFSFEPTVDIFRARRGLDVDWKYMESVVRLEDDSLFIPKVGFMIAPGFRLRGSTIKSRIYLAGRAAAATAGNHRHLPAR